MPTQQGKVMLVEDDATMRAVLKTLLEIEGYPVVSFFDQHGESDILAMVRREMPAIILLDVHLRDASGIDLLRELRADPALDRVRVIMTSGMDMKRESQQAGANAFLLKPYMPDELLNMLKG